jgi:4-hydroxybenzoate polyprenyltransferase
VLGIGLLAAGLALAAAAGQTSMHVAGLLVVAILAYDAWLKRTVLGPVAMGACRFLNVLLGLSLADPAVWPWPVRGYLALVVGLYIVGVTWFARTEARASSQTALAGAAGVMLAALLLALAVPTIVDTADSSFLFPYLLVAFGFVLALPVCTAIANPAPKPVQVAVKRAVLGLVALDAILATAVAGTVGLVLLVLLLPAMYLGRWLYST